MKHLSWGNLFQNDQQFIDFTGENFLFSSTQATLLPYGKGRSYGDSCLNSSGLLIKTSPLHRTIDLDKKNGLITCEAGMTLEDILAFIVPQGFIIQALPGTKNVTIGGAIANDVHGKNHHQVGSFGHHVQEFELRRSDGSILHCSRIENSTLFHATIGGLGLTGLISRAKIKVAPITSAYFSQMAIPFYNFSEYLTLLTKYESENYLYSWLSPHRFGHGLLFVANQSKDTNKSLDQTFTFSIPENFPSFLTHPFFFKIFNEIYFHQSRQKKLHYNDFFFPLDRIQNINRIYGRNGFFQYHFCVPLNSFEAIPEAFRILAQFKISSSICVLKKFGAFRPDGLLSFSSEGHSLSIELKNSSAQIHECLKKLDELVCAMKGKIYPAKDARMPADVFKKCFPQHAEFSTFIDPQFSSDFWRRVSI